MVSVKIGPSDDTMKSSWQKIVNKTIWLIGTARNAILVIVTGGISYALRQSGQNDLQIIGDIPPGLPTFQVPPFFIPEIRNETGAIIQNGETFSEMVSSMGSSLIVVPLIALLENVAVCKAFANGKSVDATQELLAIGASNIVNSFVQGFPGTGSLSRGAVNNASGVRTPLGSLYTGVLVILALLFMTPLFYFIPKSALASIIISAVVFMIEVRVIKPMWRSKSKWQEPYFNCNRVNVNSFFFIAETDLIPGMAAFVACLVLPLEIGILSGIAINVVFILYHAARPKISIDFLSVRILKFQHK